MAQVAVEGRPRRSGALEELVRRYGRLIKAAVAKVVHRHPSAADDVEQHVVLALWRRIEGDGEAAIEHPATYVYRCAVREAVRAVRREDARAADELHEDLPAGAPTPDDALRGREMERLLTQALHGLSAERRDAVRAHLAGFSVEEIMGLQGWPYEKARNLIARGMADLRARLRAEGVDVA